MVNQNEELQVLHVRDLQVAGLYKDVSPASDAMPKQGFQDCLNTRFRLGKLEVVPGWSQFGINALDTRVMTGGQYAKQDGTTFLVAISKTSAYVYNTATRNWDVISSSIFTGGDDDMSSLSVGFDTLVITNAKDRVKKWTGVGAVADLGGLTDAYPGGVNVSQAKIIRFINGFSIAMGTAEDGVEYPQRVRWGRQGFLEVWKNDVNGNGQAGYYDLLDTPDVIIASEPTAAGLLIMKERSLWFMQYVGLPAVWFFRQVSASADPFGGIGLIAPNAYTTVGDEIVLLGQDNFYTFAGYALQVLGDSRIKTAFFNDLNSLYQDRINLFYVEEEDEIWCVYPSLASTGQLDKAVVYNRVTKTWSFRTSNSISWFKYSQFTNLTWDTMPDVSWDATVGNWNDRRLLTSFPLTLFGDPDGKIMEYGGVYSQDGVAYTKNAETRLFDMARPDINKRVERVEIARDRSIVGTLNVYIGHCASPGDTIVYAGPFPLDMVNGKRYFTCDITDVFFDLKFETTDTTPYSIYEYKIWYKEKTQQ